MVMDSYSLFLLWLSLKEPFTPSSAAAEASLPISTAYRKLKELEDRGWLERRGKVYAPTERAKILSRMEMKEILGVFLIEELFSRALRLVTGDWRKSMDLLKESGVDFVLCYETAAYLRTGFQTPSAVFAYVKSSDLARLLHLGEKASKLADLILIPVKELPISEVVKDWPVVTEERLKLELIAWLGRGVLDLAALGADIPMVSEELTDVIY